MRTIGLATSFGFGDRTGLATPGHVQAWQRAGRAVIPVFAQQSIREMDRTGRSPDQVIGDAERGLRSVLGDGRSDVSGADADHLKSVADIAATAGAGFRTFTLDPSDHIDEAAAELPDDALRDRLRALGDDQRWLDRFSGREIGLDSGTRLQLDATTCARTLAMYGRGLRKVLDLGEALRAVHERLPRDHARRGFEIEVSLDETAAPTTLAAHWIVAALCLEHGLPLVAVAPRLPGAFEKGVDHRGDRAQLERALHDHAALARTLGGHKLSLHSGSDKLSVYALLARTTRGRCHVKTAGTTWLEGLRVVARRDATLFRRILRFARDRYATARASYELSARLDDALPPDPDVDATTLEAAYLGDPRSLTDGHGFTTPGRQIVHCTYGDVWQHTEFGPGVRAVLEADHELHHELVSAHFERHLRALTAGLP